MSVVDQLATEFRRRFPARDPARRRLGREAEFPVVHPDGTAADIAVLWPRLAAQGRFDEVREGELVVGLDGEGVSYSAEVGRGTIELIVGPADDLFGIRDAIEAGMARIVRAAEAEGLLVLGYGIQPVTPATPALMTPKKRYGVLLDVLGDLWLSFALTASDQCHVDVTVDEVPAATSLANLLAPLTIALCANSPIAGGVPTGWCSTREAGMGRIGADGFRHGMTQGPSPTIEAWIERTFDLPFLMRKVDGWPVPHQGTFRAWVDAALASGTPVGEAFDGWLFHEHYVWNSARPRVAHGTVELRSPCQQPWAEHLAAAALGTGLVAGHREIAAFVDERLGADAWPAMRAWHTAAVRDGLAAPEPVPGLVAGVLDRAREALVRRGRGEAPLLDAVEARWARRRNPAQEALAAFEKGGIPALVAHARVR